MADPASPGDSAPLTEALDSQEMIAELYSELRRLAARMMRRETSGTLQPTALIHEVYLKLCQQEGAHWADKNHFLAVACQIGRASCRERV